MLALLPAAASGYGLSNGLALMAEFEARDSPPPSPSPSPPPPPPLPLPPAPSRLASLLQSFNVTANTLASMSAQTYVLPGVGATPGNPQPVGTWNPTPYPKLVIPGIHYESLTADFSILAFRGAYSAASDCVVPKYLFTDTPAEKTWERICKQQLLAEFQKDGSWAEVAKDAQWMLPAVAAQLEAVLDAHPSVKLLTGHSLGCVSALSLGRVRGLPVVCFGAPGSFGKVWMDNWPGLAAAVSASTTLPPREDLFTVQTTTDPFSMCLTPRLGVDPTRVWAGTTCAIPVPYPGCAVNVSFSYDIASPCAVQGHYAPVYAAATAATPTITDCSDLCEASVAVCPQLPPSPPLTVQPYKELCASS